MSYVGERPWWPIECLNKEERRKRKAKRRERSDQVYWSWIWKMANFNIQECKRKARRSTNCIMRKCFSDLHVWKQNVTERSLTGSLKPSLRFHIQTASWSLIMVCFQLNLAMLHLIFSWLRRFSGGQWECSLHIAPQSTFVPSRLRSGLKYACSFHLV